MGMGHEGRAPGAIPPGRQGLGRGIRNLRQGLLILVGMGPDGLFHGIVKEGFVQPINRGWVRLG